MMRGSGARRRVALKGFGFVALIATSGCATWEPIGVGQISPDNNPPLRVTGGGEVKVIVDATADSTHVRGERRRPSCYERRDTSEHCRVVGEDVAMPLVEIEFLERREYMSVGKTTLVGAGVGAAASAVAIASFRGPCSGDGVNYCVMHAIIGPTSGAISGMLLGAIGRFLQGAGW